jgi:YhcN/YlaJ family sporulation lipoprotein
MKRFHSWMGGCGAFLLLVGCQPANKPPGGESAPPARHSIPETVRVKQTAPEPTRDRNPQAIAERMVKLAVGIPQVRGASAISLGPYTLVGIDVDPTLDRGRVGTVKYTVAQALHEDPQGTNALVTADVDLVARIRSLSHDLKNGRPVAGILEELAEIAGRIVPQPSRETKKREEPAGKVNQQRINPPGRTPSRP